MRPHITTLIAFIGKDIAETVISAILVSETQKVRSIPYGDRSLVQGICYPSARVADLASQPPACNKPAQYHARNGC